MTEQSTLERTAILAILGEADLIGSPLTEALLAADVTARSNTGGGFFTDLLVPGAMDGAWSTSPLGEDVWISIDGLEYGLGMLLFVQDWPNVLLEGYAVGPEDTSTIDFRSVRFRLSESPKAFGLNN